MKRTSNLSVMLKVACMAIIGFLMSPHEASARKLYLVKGGSDIISLSNTNFSYAPGDTFVLRASQNPYNFLELESIQGTANAPIVIINEGGQVVIGQIRERNCRFLKITGTGSGDFYGFYMSSTNVAQPAFGVGGRTSDIEIDHADINGMGYGFWVKEEGSCDPALQFPNWTINNISMHDNRIRNIVKEGFYVGSTAPNGERAVICNGTTTYPIPLRLGNIKIYNNIVDHTGRGGIQLSSAPYGNNEIYGNTVTNCGYEWDEAQGNGIVLGGYTTAYIHDNTVNTTLSTGIFSLGAGLVRIENNRVDNSGQLEGRVTSNAASVMVDTRLTNPVMNTTFSIKNNTLGANKGGHIIVYNNNNSYGIGNVICNNITSVGTLSTYVIAGVYWTNCAAPANKNPTADAGLAQTITLPITSVALNGAGTDPDGVVAAYAWTMVSGPNTPTFTTPNAASTLVNGLVQGSYVFRLTVTDNNGATATSDVNVTVSAAGSSSIATMIQAENYSLMGGIATENTSDAGGGLDVTSLNNGDWMEYKLTMAAAGTYTLNMRVASAATGAHLMIGRPDGSILASLNIPNTGGTQNWQTISTTISLAAGQQTIRVSSTEAPTWNFNWMEITTPGSTSTPVVSPTPTTSTSSSRIEAESYSAMNGIAPENTADAGGGLDITSINNGDWMEYKVTAPAAGSYTLNLRVASAVSGGYVMIGKLTGAIIGSSSIPNTGGAQNWQTLPVKVTLDGGQQVIRVASTENPSWNLNWLELVGGTTSSQTSTSTTTTSTGSTRVEAENWSSMNGVTTETTTDAGGGQDVTALNNGDWMEYKVTAPAAGTYTVNFRVASSVSGGYMMIGKLTGAIIGSASIPNTGGAQSWQTVPVKVTLDAGQQVIRVASTENPSWNLNWLEFSFGSTVTATPSAPSTSTSTSTTPATHIEAETYSNMSGVTTENTSDAGGGQDVTSLNNGDWMEYKVTTSVAGTYTLNLRVASALAGAHLMIGKIDGSILASVNVPNTGGAQNWQTISTTISLVAGQQTIRVASTENPAWNLNWLEIASASGTVQAKGTVESTQQAASSLEVFPNPIQDRFQLKVNNSFTGVMQVRVLDLQGNVVKSFTLNKPNAGAFQSYLSLGGIQAGSYLLQTTINNQQQTKQIVKE